jgi:DNA-binding CsgD family transcriptional regulator
MRLHRSTRPNATQPIAGERAMLVVDANGDLRFMTPRAARWLKDFSLSRSSHLPDGLARWLDEIVSSGRPARFILDRAGTQLCFQVICREPKSICVLLEQRAHASKSNDVHGRLTERQIEVLSWVARGKTNAEIAKILSLKTGTIGKYLERIFPKLGVENRTAAASFVLGASDVS